VNNAKAVLIDRASTYLEVAMIIIQPISLTAAFSRLLPLSFLKHCTRCVYSTSASFEFERDLSPLGRLREKANDIGSWSISKLDDLMLRVNQWQVGACDNYDVAQVIDVESSSP
jgi:hypothetical protein